MIRFRRRTCITLGFFILFICLIMMGLKTLRPDSAAFGNPFGLGLLPEIERPSPANTFHKPRKGVQNMEIVTKGLVPLKPIISESEMEALPSPNFNIHVFYYTWYGSPQFNDKYIHWNHPLLKHWDTKVANSFPTGRHNPPDDVGADFYPELGPYSSRDPSVIEAHMKQIRSASIGDGGYSCTEWLLTPYNNPQTRSQVRFNEAHRSTRGIIERTFGSGGAMQYAPEKVAKIILVCCILHNIAIKRGCPLEDDDPIDADDLPEEICVEQANRRGNATRDMVSEQYFED